MKAIITGSDGQLGRAFQKELTRRNIPYFGTDIATCDISKPDQVNALFDKHQPTVLINCASYNLVEEAENKSDLAILVNAFAVKILATVCQARGVKFVHYSTDYVFDGQKGDLYDENDTPHPLNVYGISKLAGENNAKTFASDHLILRTSWLYGQGVQNFPYKVSQWAQKNKVLRISADEVSVPTSADDLVMMTLQSLEKGLKGLYHATNSSYASRYELTRHYLKLAGHDVLTIPVPMASFPSKVARPLFSAMSNRKLSQELGIRIPTWQEALERYVADRKGL